MKSKNSKSLIVIVIGVVLLIAGISFAFTTSSSTDKPEDKKDPVVEEKKELRKILEEELNDETAKEIIQFYLNQDTSSEKRKVLSAKLIASTLTGKYLVRVELENDNDDKRDTSIQYLEDGKWSVQLPLNYAGDIPEEYTEFFAVDGE